MNSFQVKPVGNVSIKEGEMSIELKPEYIPALQGIDGFRHLNIIWWFNDFDKEEMRNVLEAPKPYKKAPDIIGIFATRSPIRPNPIALSAVEIMNIDHEKGIIHIAWIDANDGSPVIDIKPYTPSCDRIEDPGVPEWCRHWPMSVEQSEDFDWENEFNF